METMTDYRKEARRLIRILENELGWDVYPYSECVKCSHVSVIPANFCRDCGGVMRKGNKRTRDKTVREVAAAMRRAMGGGQ